ncbi:hypothetical protein [Bacillus sp. NSP9.1]|uniref:hypothetical protein n=1 Tax=Bacillus sp. NSP9.1 TaxID=1071078 RepID=UPI0013D455F5|nr:hypothetical protein [Bacillus sp. NSP9.1]
MFKQRLIGALAYLAALTLLLGLFSAGCLTGFVIMASVFVTVLFIAVLASVMS